MDIKFDRIQTNSTKGFALLLLLWHHLFYTHPEYGFITFNIALLSKVCVAIFVMLSGYGYSESVKKHTKLGLLEFYKNRVCGLYLNYWFIAFIFVVIGSVFLGITVKNTFNSTPYLKFIIQMSGAYSFFFNDSGYNGTWWYMSAIIPLTILFPFIYDLVKKYGLIIIFFFSLLPLQGIIIFPVLSTWFLPFTLGIYYSEKNFFETFSNRISKLGNLLFPVLLLGLISVAILRQKLPIIGGVKMDWLFASIIILLIFEISKKFCLIRKWFNFLGSHLFNIFLFHTFIYHLFWSKYIYYFKNPILIFLTLFIICILISLLLEFVKKKLYFYKLLNKIINLKIPKKVEVIFKKDLML